MIKRIVATIGVTGMLLSPLASFAADGANNDFLGLFVEGNGVSGGNRFSFDMREFRSHPCFSAVGNEQEYCLDLFGIDTDFEEMIRTNSLNSLLVDYMLARRCEGLFNDALSACQKENVALLPQLRAQMNTQAPTTTGSTVGAATDDDDAQEDEATADTPRSRYLRSQRVWAMCKDHSNTQAGCYQDYLRFVTDERLQMSELAKVLGIPPDTDDENENEDDNDDNDSTSTRSNAQVGSEQEEEPSTREDRANWLWDLCADASNQSICYRQHFRTAQKTTDFSALEAEVREM